MTDINPLSAINRAEGKLASKARANAKSVAAWKTPHHLVGVQDTFHHGTVSYTGDVVF